MHEPDTFAAVRVEEHGPVDAAGCEVANVMGEQFGAASAQQFARVAVDGEVSAVVVVNRYGDLGSLEALEKKRLGNEVSVAEIRHNFRILALARREVEPGG